MIPFDRTWPYEKVKTDIFVAECPFCASSNILLPLKLHEIQEIHEGKKKILVFPCCSNRLKIVDTDEDYFLTDMSLRKK